MPIYLGYKDIISELIKTKINGKFKFRYNIRRGNTLTAIQG